MKRHYKMVIIGVLCLCACSNNKSKLIKRYTNVEYSVNQNNGYVNVVYIWQELNPITYEYEIKERKNWEISDNKITVWYSSRFDYSINNYFYVYKDFYRLLVFN